MQPYLVTEHRDPIGDNPVQNALNVRNTLDQAAIEKKRSDLYQRQLDITEKAQNMKDLYSQLELVGSKSPAGQQIQHEILGHWGVSYDPNSTDPETVTNVVDNGIKGWEKIKGDPKMSTEAKQTWVFQQQQAAAAALARTGGTKSERAASADASKSIYGEMGKSLAGEDATTQHGIQVGQSLGASKTMAGIHLDNSKSLVDYKQQHGIGGGAGGRTPRADIDASGTYASMRKGLEEGYHDYNGKRVAWNALPLEEQTKKLSEAYTMAKAATGAQGKLSGVPGEDPTAIGPAPGEGMRPDLPAPAAKPAASTGDPGNDAMIQSMTPVFDSVRSSKAPASERRKMLFDQARAKGLDVTYNPETGDVTAGRKRPHDADLLLEVLKSVFSDEDLQNLFAE